MKACANHLSRTACSMCGGCMEACPSGARELVGREVTPDDVMGEIEKDIVFYEESGGGVTFSGGEPLMQPDFLKEMLAMCRHKGIHTCLDTTGYGETFFLLEISSMVDLFLYDLKIMDDEKHKKYTGVSNGLIIKNLAELSNVHDNIYIRFPLIPEVNDDRENILAMGELVGSLKGIKQLNILPYHSLGIDKYNRLQKECMLSTIKSPSAESIHVVKEQLEGYGIQIKVRS